jgi:hypothetical protein
MNEGVRLGHPVERQSLRDRLDGILINLGQDNIRPVVRISVPGGATPRLDNRAKAFHPPKADSSRIRDKVVSKYLRQAFPLLVIDDVADHRKNLVNSQDVPYIEHRSSLPSMRRAYSVGTYGLCPEALNCFLLRAIAGQGIRRPRLCAAPTIGPTLLATSTPRSMAIHDDPSDLQVSARSAPDSPLCPVPPKTQAVALV